MPPPQLYVPLAATALLTVRQGVGIALILLSAALVAPWLRLRFSRRQKL